MKRARNVYVDRAPLLVRLFRFWFPIFLFVYLSYLKIITLTLPVRGPFAFVGWIVPVPIGVTDNGHTLWYRDVLRIALWNKELGGELSKTDIRTWAELYELIGLFGKEMNVETHGGLLSGKEEELTKLHEVLVASTETAQRQGLYQTFALERVEQIRSLIELGIYFPDLAYQYSSLESAPEKGVRTLLFDQLPESYKEAIGKDEVTLVETDTDYVFVKIEDMSSDGLSGQYRVTELGIAKQDLRKTFYAYLLEHSIKWF